MTPINESVNIQTRRRLALRDRLIAAGCFAPVVDVTGDKVTIFAEDLDVVLRKAGL